MTTTGSAAYDVFLSHNSADKGPVEFIARRLRDEAQLAPFLDAWHLVPGEPWQEALEQALDSSRTCAVFLGPVKLGTWENEEMRAALDIRAGSPDFRVIPVLLPGAQLPERGRLPHFLARLTWVDFRSGLDDAQAFHELVSGIQGVAPDSGTIAAVTICPFRGLEVFEAEHAEFFFGREALIQHLVEQLRHDRFLAVLGASGSGKSSLARAGLVPQLLEDALPGSSTWPAVIFKPGANPLATLAARLLPLLGAGTDPLAAQQSLLDALKRDERGLHGAVQLALGAAPDSRRMLLVVDQFEEVFTLCRDDAERRQFIGNLLYASSIAGGQTFAVLTMRVDFLSKCTDYPTLPARVAERDVLVGPMEVDELRRAMLGPAEKVGLHYEKGLVEIVLDDLGGEPGQLPLLQHTLLELWEQRRGAWLTTDAYYKIGGVRGAIARRAELVYSHLTAPQQAAVRRVLLRLTQPGEGTEDTRRRAPLAELLPAGTGAADVESVVRELADARLVMTGTDEQGAQIVDVTHEALIRGWPRLRSWIDQDREALRIQRQITEDAEEWDQHKEDASFLYRGARLAVALEWENSHAAELNDLESRFLHASRAARDAERRAAQRRTRWTIAGLAGALTIISLLGVVALWSKRNSDIAGRLDRSRFLVERGRRIADERPLVGMRLALEGLALAPPQRPDGVTELTRTVADLAGQGRVRLIGTDGASLFPSPDDAVFILRRTGANGELRRTADGNLIGALAAEVQWVEFSPTGSAFLVTYADEAREVRRAADGGLVAALVGTSAQVFWSPDDRAFVVGYNDAPGELRRTDSGEVVAQLPHNIEYVEFSPKGTAFRVEWYGSSDEETPQNEVRRTDTGALLAVLPGEGFGVHFSPDERIFVVQLTAEPDKVYWTDRGAEIRFDGKVRDVILSPTDATFVISYGDRPGELRNADGDVVRLAATVRDVTFSPAGTALAIAYEAQPGELRGTDGGIVAVLSGILRGISFSPKGTFFVADYEDKPAELRRTDGGTLVTTFTDEYQFAFAEFTEDESGFVLSRTRDGRMAAVGGGQVPSEPQSAIESRSLTQDCAGEQQSYGVPGDVRRTSDGASIGTLTEEDYDLIFSPMGNAFAVYYGGAPNELRTTAESEPIPLSGTLCNAVFTRDGTVVVLNYDDKPGELRRADTGAVISPLSGRVLGVSFSADGTAFVVDYADRPSEVWDVQGSPRRLATLDIEKQASVFAPEGERLVVQNLTGEVHLIDVAWLRTMKGDPDASAESDLRTLACTFLLSSELWTADEEAALRNELGPQAPRACS